MTTLINSTPEPDSIPQVTPTPNAPDPAGGNPNPNPAGSPQTPVVPRVESAVFEIPEPYKKEPWAEDLKSSKDVWTKLAGAQKLIGRKGIIPPQANATPEEWDAFYNAQGRPEHPEGYEFKNIEELKELERNVEVDNRIKNLLHKEGIPKDKAERIVSEYEKLVYEQQKPRLETLTKAEREFQDLTKTVLGADKTTAMLAFKEIIKDTIGNKPELAQKLDELDNTSLMSLVVFAKNIHDKYVGENRIQKTALTSNNLTGDIRTDFRTLSEQKLKLRLDAGVPEHIKTQKLQYINSEIMKLGQKASEQNINLFE